jgi:hypothetical protein
MRLTLIEIHDIFYHFFEARMASVPAVPLFTFRGKQVALQRSVCIHHYGTHRSAALELQLKHLHLTDQIIRLNQKNAQNSEEWEFLLRQLLQTDPSLIDSIKKVRWINVIPEAILIQLGILSPQPIKRIEAAADTAWFNDTQIANLAHLLIHRYTAISPGWKDHFQALYPLSHELFHAAVTKEEPPSLIVGAKRGEYILFIFVNKSQMHWVLIVIDHERIYLIDPLGISFNNEWVKPIQALFDGFSVIDLQTCYQEDGFNCGVWCLHLMTRYIQHKMAGGADFPSTQNVDITSIRSDYMCYLQTSSLLYSDEEKC